MLVTISRCPATLLAPHMPAGMAVRCWGWSRITWKGRLVSSSHWVTAAASLAVSLLSRSLLSTASTPGSSTGRNLHTSPYSSKPGCRTGQRSNLICYYTVDKQ